MRVHERKSPSFVSSHIPKTFGGTKINGGVFLSYSVLLSLQILSRLLPSRSVSTDPGACFCLFVGTPPPPQTSLTMTYFPCLKLRNIQPSLESQSFVFLGHLDVRIAIDVASFCENTSQRHENKPVCVTERGR